MTSEKGKSLALNYVTVSAKRIEDGRLFHSVSAATEKLSYGFTNMGT